LVDHYHQAKDKGLKKMPKAIWNGRVVAETDQYETVEGIAL
jgi:uncharacterized protein (DUF427 family)